MAVDIPDKENVDLIMVGATGLNTFERLLIGSSSEYILRHARLTCSLFVTLKTPLVTSHKHLWCFSHMKKNRDFNSQFFLFYFSDFADSDITSDSEVDWLSRPRLH